ncbi:unnamed protein product [Penicillium manginii]
MSNPMSSPQPNPTIQSLATRIKTGQITRIVVLTGAGISTSAGIPDFRSPTTGLYDKLAPLNLPYPEALFHISYFSHSPEPFYAIARARHPANLKPTLSHAFLALLAKKNILHFLFTQNVDNLEEKAGIPAEKVLAVHGSWKSQHCWTCKASYPDELMEKAINAGEVPYCLEAGCGGAIKPDVVFFGENLPSAFDEKIHLISEAECMLVLGTSLRVAPCSTIPRQIAAGSCDEGVCQFADALGWRDELEDLWREVGGAETKPESMDGPDLDACIAKAAEQMDARLGISQGHKRMLEGHLSDKFAKMMADRAE